MAISERRMQTAIKKYNDLMYMLCCEHNTIGTKLSERTEEWNLRDMVSECQYQLDCYYEEGHNAYEQLHALDGCTMTIEDLMDEAAIVIFQMEIPQDMNRYAIDMAKSHGCKVMMNAAPAAPFEEEYIQKCDIFIVNEVEAGFYAGKTIDTMEKAAEELTKK